MNDMIKAEREKILLRKPVKILFLLGIVVIAVYFLLFQFNYTSVFYNDDTGKMEMAKGFASIERRKEIAALFAGELEPGTLTLMQEKIAEAKRASRDENALSVYRDQAAILEYFTEPDGTLKPIGSAYHATVTLGYCDGWDQMLSSMGGVLAILMTLLIVVALSPVFSEESACHTDSVIFAARYGKTKLVTAKAVASLEVVIGIYFIFLLLHMALYLGVYGAQGWNVSIQSSLHYAASNYGFTFLQMFIVSITLNILGIAAMTITTLLCSAKMRTPVTALASSCAVCFLPVFFDFSESVPSLQKLQELCPIFLLHMNGVFASVKTYMGIRQPIIMVLLNLGAACFLFGLIKNTMKRYQVMGN